MQVATSAMSRTAIRLIWRTSDSSIILGPFYAAPHRSTRVRTPVSGVRWCADASGQLRISLRDGRLEPADRPRVVRELDELAQEPDLLRGRRLPAALEVQPDQREVEVDVAGCDRQREIPGVERRI